MKDLKTIILNEHKERKDVIYTLVKDFKEIAMTIRRHSEDIDDEDIDDGEAPVSAHALSVVSDSIKDLLQVGIKNDELIIKLIDIKEKYNKSKDDDEEEEESGHNESSDFEKELLKMQDKTTDNEKE